MTPEQIQARLDRYIAAEQKILDSQRYKIGQGATAREQERAELSEVRAEIKSLQAQIASLTPRRARYLRPC